MLEDISIKEHDKNTLQQIKHSIYQDLFAWSDSPKCKLQIRSSIQSYFLKGAENAYCVVS